MTDLERAKEQYPRLVVVEVDGKTLAFRPLDRAKITDIRKRLSKAPDIALDILTNVCEFQCVVGAEHFKEIAVAYPLLMAGEDSISDALMQMARGSAVVTVS
jgi:hypothetical protein